LRGLNPFCLIFIRFFRASLCFGVVLLGSNTPPISQAAFKKLFLLALFQPGLYFFFETYGLKYASATKTSLIIATIPITVLVCSVIFLKEKLRLHNAVGVLLSLAGVALLIFGGAPVLSAEGDLLGDLLILGAVSSATVYMILARHLGQTISPVQITGLQMIFGCLLFLPFFLWNVRTLNWAAIGPDVVGAVLGLTVFATIGAFSCYNFALSRMPASRVSVFINGIPIVTACGAWFLLGESMATLQMLGGVIVIGSVYLANYRSSP